MATFTGCSSVAYDDGNHRSGDVVWASVRNPLQNSKSVGKFRPFLLVRRTDGHWAGMGLTTNPRFKNGDRRVAIPNPDAVGLLGPGFLWGDRLTDVSVLDLGAVIGRVDRTLSEIVIRAARLSGNEAAALRAAAGPSQAHASSSR